MTESKLPSDLGQKATEKKSPTVLIGDHPDAQKYEDLKAKLRHKQAKRESQHAIDHQAVRLSIEASALSSKTFYIMNTLSAVIAGYGLLSNSPAVVIGAMLVAMMLGPISGIALALIDHRMLMLRTSLLTLLGGVGAVVGVGVVLGLLHYDVPMTAEILVRTKPNVMDLMIALAGGAAGAFASISSRLSVAVVGVAVATALVPPLVAAGILLAHLDFSLAIGALLLAFTNMVAIQFSSSLVLWIAGFRRLRHADLANTHWAFIKRNLISLSLLIGLGIYLTINLTVTLGKQRYQSGVTQQLKQQLEQGNSVLVSTHFVPRPDHLLVRAVLRGDQPPTVEQVAQIQHTLSPSREDLPTRLQIRFVPVLLIQADDQVDQPLNTREAQQLRLGNELP